MNPTTKGEDYYTHLTFIENGKVWPRRVGEMTFQWRGQFYRLTGVDLPESAVWQSNKSHTGYGIVDILLRPDRLPPIPIEVEQDRGFMWPVRRDVFHVAVGFAGMQVLCAAVKGFDAFVWALVRAFQDAIMM